MRNGNSISRFGIIFGFPAERDGNVGATAKAPNAKVFGVFGLFPLHLFHRFYVQKIIHAKQEDINNNENDINMESTDIAIEQMNNDLESKVNNDVKQMNNPLKSKVNNDLEEITNDLDNKVNNDTDNNNANNISDCDIEINKSGNKTNSLMNNSVKYMERPVSQLLFEADKYVKFARQFLIKFKALPYYLDINEDDPEIKTIQYFVHPDYAQCDEKWKKYHPGENSFKLNSPLRATLLYNMLYESQINLESLQEHEQILAGKTSGFLVKSEGAIHLYCQVCSFLEFFRTYIMQSKGIDIYDVDYIPTDTDVALVFKHTVFSEFETFKTDPFKPDDDELKLGFDVTEITDWFEDKWLPLNVQNNNLENNASNLSDDDDTDFGDVFNQDMPSDMEQQLKDKITNYHLKQEWIVKFLGKGNVFYNVSNSDMFGRTITSATVKGAIASCKAYNNLFWQIYLYKIIDAKCAWNVACDMYTQHKYMEMWQLIRLIHKNKPHWKDGLSLWEQKMFSNKNIYYSLYIKTKKVWKISCYTCKKALFKRKRKYCKRCKTVYYCSKKCQKIDWKYKHHLQCLRIIPWCTK